MQPRSASSIAAAPLMDLIGPPAQRARPTDGELPFESLVELRPSRDCGSCSENYLPLPRAAESKAAEVSPREESEGSDLPPARCGNESLPQETTEQAAVDEETPADDVDAIAQVEEDRPTEDAADPRSAEELLAASLPVINATPAQPVVVDAPTAADGTAESGSEAATDLETTAIGILEAAPSKVVGLATALDVSASEAVADVNTATIPGSNTAAIVAAAAHELPPDALPTQLATGVGQSAAAAEAPADIAASAADEPVTTVDPSADESPDRQEPEAQTETFQPPELPPDSQLPPLANVAAPQNDSRPSAATNSAILPPVDAAASNRQRIPDAILGSPGTANARPAQELAVDSVRLLQRVARRCCRGAQRGSEVRLRLSPPELGALRLEVQIRDGAMVARVEAETSAARTAIIENLPALRERLAEQGVRIERFEVDLMHQQGSGTPDQSAHGDREPVAPPRAVARAEAPLESSTVQPKAATSPAGSGRLNVIV